MRKKNPDVKSAGRSKIVPYIPGEDPEQRHLRRVETNFGYVEELVKWCNENGWVFQIKNERQHWIFKKNNSIVEWWPSSAKLVKNKQWSKGVHCHDYMQVILILGKEKL